MLALRRAARRARVQVIYINDHLGLWRGNQSELVARALRGRGKLLARKLRPGPRDLFVLKPGRSGFFQSPLESLLNSLGARRLVVAGLATDICVLATVSDAVMRKWRCHVPADVTASLTPERHAAALSLMEETSMGPAVQRKGGGVQEVGSAGAWQVSSELMSAMGLQLREGTPEMSTLAEVHSAAAQGVSGPSESLPHLAEIRQSFGAEHDVAGVRAHVGGPAAEACDAMGASAYASGGAVAFKGSPDLHTAAHEAAHLVQQRQGVSLYGGVGAVGDLYERHADAVADRVVAGQSVSALLVAGPAGTGGSGASASSAIQHKPSQEEADLDAVKSKEIEAAQVQEKTNWPGVVAREKSRHKDIDYLLKLKVTADERTALERLSNFLKPGEVRDYVQRVTERAP